MRKSSSPMTWVVPVASAVLAFAGAVTGTYLAAKLDQSNWEQRFALEQRKSIFEKRVELMDQTASLLSRSPIMVGLQGNVDSETRKIYIQEDCLKSGVKPANCEMDFDRDVVERSAKERYSMNAELSSTLMLSGVYFGPRTNKMLREVAADPWGATKDQRKRLLDAMSSELGYF